MTKTQPTVVVVAAGQGSRFKGTQHKLEQPLDDRTVLGATIAHVQASGLPMVLVTTRALAARAAAWMSPHDIVVLSDELARRGMGHSIACGVVERASSPGWLILPADMPRVQPSTLCAVADALRQHPVVYAQYQGRRGHPVGFAAELLSELSSLTGDEGARRIVARYPVHGEEVDDPGVLMDVDTLEDLHDLQRTASVTRGVPMAAS